jgi:hypothetical protein
MNKMQLNRSIQKLTPNLYFKSEIILFFCENILDLRL